MALTRVMGNLSSMKVKRKPEKLKTRMACFLSRVKTCLRIKVRFLSGEFC